MNRTKKSINGIAEPAHSAGGIMHAIDQNSSQELQQIAADLLLLAQKQGATQAEAAVSMDIGLAVTVRGGNIESIEFNRGKSIGITVYKGKRKGAAASTDFSRAALADTVAAACNIAEYTEEDPCAGLAEKELLAVDIPDLELYHPLEISADRAIAIAKECEQYALAYDQRVKQVDSTSFSSNVHYGVYANSHGLLAGCPTSRFSLSCAVISQEDVLAVHADKAKAAAISNGMQRDYEYTVARDFADLRTAQHIGNEAARKAVARLGARKIKTTKASVLLLPEMARGIFGNFIAAISGGNLYRKTTFLLDALHSKVFPEFMQIYEDPLLKKALGSSAFDSDGVATKRKDFINAGILTSYVLGSYSARKLGMQTTANAGGVHNLTVKPGKHDFAGLIKQMHTGLVVTEMLGHGINLTTGDYSRGVCGFWVQNGEIQYPVEEVTIAGNLRDIFSNIADIGNDIDYRGNVRVGSVLLDAMTIAGE